MNHRKIALIVIGCAAIAITVVLSGLVLSDTEKRTVGENFSGEYLQIVGTRSSNPQSPPNEVETVLYLYSIDQHKVVERFILDRPALYPVACMDFAHQKIYYSGSDNNLYDNLYVCTSDVKSSRQLTHDKILFNDLFVAGKFLVGNMAPEGKTVLQPGIINTDHTIRYFNPHDDDTWFHSLSYSPATGKLLGLTCSDKEMRSARVTSKTFIRPKRILLMNPDFTEAKVIYQTEAFEIREIRQLDENHIVMITEDQMGSGKPRQLQILSLKDETLTPLNIDGFKEPQSVYPNKRGDHLYILGRGLASHFSLWDYDMKNKTLTDLLKKYPFPEGHRILVNFSYTSL